MTIRKGNAVNGGTILAEFLNYAIMKGGITVKYDMDKFTSLNQNELMTVDGGGKLGQELWRIWHQIRHGFPVIWS